MGENSSIQWTHHTFNGWIGCEHAPNADGSPGTSPECAQCYAEAGSRRFSAQHKLRLWPGHNVDGPEGRYVTSDGYWKKPLLWDRRAREAGERHRVFCASYADVFENRPELEAPRARLFNLIRSTPSLDWLLLTKRPENTDRMLPNALPSMGPRVAWPNVWLGTTVGVRASLPRVDHILAVKHLVARVFVSGEPMLEWVPGVARAGIDWLIVGGESDGTRRTRARPFNLRWARDAIRDCRAAGIAPFIKQLGANVFDEGVGLLDDEDPGAVDVVRVRLKDSHGGDWNEWPAELRVREFPVT